MSEQKPYIGGQAVLEGVMMRSPKCLTVAVRRPDGTIALREGPFRSRFAWPPWKWLGFRGVATLVESLGMGFGALRFSAEQQMTAEEREGAQDAGKWAMVLSTVLALGLFVALPQLLAAGSGELLGWELAVQDSGFHLVIGGFKLLVLLGYLMAISRVPEIRRVFQYHGAEHKTINAQEQGLPLTVDHVRAQTTLHPRCGTTFLVVVVVVSILVGSVATPLLLPNVDGALGQALTLLLRIALLPVIAAVSFELQRFGARFCTRGPLQVFLWPGYLFQKITTREPTDDQMEIAIAAMQAAEWREAVGDDVPADDEPLLFPTFASFTEALPALRSAPVPAAAE
ncbi:MAG: DUF1385 domain-containing protein [Myxococcota bacterium]